MKNKHYRNKVTGTKRASILIVALLALVLLLFTSGCGIPWKHINALHESQNIGKEVLETYPHLSANISYNKGDSDLQKLDIYGVAPGESAPVYVFIHGGFWQYGHRSEYASLGKTITDQGWILVLVDYRLFPKVAYPEIPKDCIDAVNWIHAHIAEYGGDPNRMIIAGHSAGAQLTTVLLTDDDYRSQLEFDPLDLAGAAILSGPFDFSSGSKNNVKGLRKVMGDEATFDKAQPINYPRKDLPPLLIMNGEFDKLTPEPQAAAYAKLMTEAGADVRYEMLSGGDHYSMMVDMIPGFEGPALKLLADFANEKFKARAEAVQAVKKGCSNKQGAGSTHVCTCAKKNCQEEVVDGHH